MGLSPLLTSSIIYAVIISFFGMALTLVWTRTNTCDFAAADRGVIGMYFALVMVRLWQMNLYKFMWLPPLLSAGVSLLVYIVLIKPLRERGATSEEIMIATLGFSLFTGAFLSITADSLVFFTDITRGAGWSLSRFNFPVAGISSLLIVSLGVFIISFLSIHLLFTRTDIGIALRAAGYNSNLAEVVGVDTEKIYKLTWFLSGYLTGLAGVLYTVYTRVWPQLGASILIVIIFSGVILGGTKGIYDAVAGAWIIAFAKVGLIGFLAGKIGLFVLRYSVTVPLVVMVIVLLFFPGGLARINWQSVLNFLKTPKTNLKEQVK